MQPFSDRYKLQTEHNRSDELLKGLKENVKKQKSGSLSGREVRKGSPDKKLHQQRHCTENPGSATSTADDPKRYFRLLGCYL